MTARKDGRLGAIDALRGAAALSVVAYHAINFTDAVPVSRWLSAVHAVLDRGYLGVPLFFVISGFCIHLRAAARHAQSGEQRVDYLAFWKRRLLRLYPPYVAALCVSMALVIVAYLLGRNVPLLALYAEPKAKSIAVDFAMHLTMLHGFHPVFDKAGGNPPFWTLAREEYFYVMYFALLAWRRRFDAVTTAASILALGVAFPILVRPFLPDGAAWTALLMSSAVVLWIQWCLGMVAVENYVGLVRLPSWCSAIWLVPVWGCGAAYSDITVPLAAPALWGMTFFTLVNYCVTRETAGEWPRHRIVKWLEGVGIYSYSLYLIHNPVRGVMNQILPVWFRAQPIAYIAAAAIIAVAGCVAGRIFYLVIESRFLPSRRPHVPEARLIPAEVLAQS